MKRIGILGLVVAVLLCVPVAEAGSEQGISDHVPWSGYWWPVAKGELLIPLGKYDDLTGSAAAQWERSTHPPGPNNPDWHGYCHGWAASTILEKEPRAPRRAAALQGGRNIVLSVGDQKGLLAASHTHDLTNQFGDRFGDGQGNEDYHDPDPCTLWEILRTFIKEQRVPLVIDLDASAEVWNYPVYAYRVDYWPTGGLGQQMAQLALWAADDAVPPDYVGLSMHYQTYTFTFQVYNGSILMGSGRWVGQSEQNHPDYAWYPYIVIPENPYLDYNRVKQLVGPGSSSADSGSSATSGARPNEVSESSTDVRPNAIPGAASGAVPGIFGPDGGAVPGNVALLSPLQVVAAIAEQTSSFGLDVTVDRFDGGQYAVGDRLQVRGSSQQAGHLYIFDLDSQAELTLLFPSPGQDNRIAAGERFAVPSGEGKAVLRAQQPFGVHRIKAVVTDRPLLMTGLVWQGPPQQPEVQSEYRPGRFRWYPSQRRVALTLLKQYQQQRQLSASDLDGVKIPDLLGSFAQDEVAYYVGPR